MFDLLIGIPGAKSKYDTFYYMLNAVRAGEWKYFQNGQLYNLKNDIGETQNVAKQYPAIAARMKQLLINGQEDLKNPANCRPVGREEKPFKFLIPRPGKTGEEAHSPVNPALNKK